MNLRVASGIMTRPEVLRLFASAQDISRDLLLLRLLYFTGLRRAEMVHVLAADVLWELDALYIRSGKGDKDRLVLVDPVTMKLLAEHLQGVPLERPIFDHTDKWVHDVFLIHGKELIEEYKARGLRLSPHSLRYAFSTHFHDGGLSLQVITALLGHVLPQDTVDYLDTSRDLLEEAYARCNPYGPGAPPSGLAAPPQIPSQAMTAEAYREREREFRNQVRAGRTNGLPMFATPGELVELLAASGNLLLRTLYASGMWVEDALRACGRHLQGREVVLGTQVAMLDEETAQRLAGRPEDSPLFEVGLEEALAHLLECGERTGLAQRLRAAQAPLSLDSLRHAFAVHSAARGMDVVTLMRLLGHQYFTSTQPFLQAAVYRHLGAYRGAVPL